MVAVRRIHRSAASLIVAAGLLVVAPAFLQMSGTRASARHMVKPFGAVPSTNGADSPTEEASPGFFGARGIAVVAALMMAVAAPRASYGYTEGGLLGQWINGYGGDVKYNDPASLDKAKLADSRASVLESAAAQAQKRAVQAVTEAAEKAKAAELFDGLNSSRSQEAKKKEEQLGLREEQRAQVLKQMEQKSSTSTSEDVPKAQAFFKMFFQQQQEERKAVEVQDKRQASAREQVNESLQQRKSDAKKAAEEAEAIAMRIEELAKQARAAADEAKRQAA
mmetsp:Transcript_58454/g.189348  ORF Transcript_58454/g.189348 Transcript_58454/m.189348 type:complete len:279 (+) Transcript_58454:128-964(+)